MSVSTKYVENVFRGPGHWQHSRRQFVLQGRYCSDFVSSVRLDLEYSIWSVVRPARVPRPGASFGPEAPEVGVCDSVGGSVGGVDGFRNGLFRPGDRRGAMISRQPAGISPLSLGGSANSREGGGGGDVCKFVGAHDRVNT